jgi:hypothetical protein
MTPLILRRRAVARSTGHRAACTPRRAPADHRAGQVALASPGPALRRGRSAGRGTHSPANPANQDQDRAGQHAAQAAGAPNPCSRSDPGASARTLVDSARLPVAPPRAVVPSGRTSGTVTGFLSTGSQASLGDLPATVHTAGLHIGLHRPSHGLVGEDRDRPFVGRFHVHLYPPPTALRTETQIRLVCHKLLFSLGFPPANNPSDRFRPSGALRVYGMR